MEVTDRRYASRKFILAAFALLAGTSLLVARFITSDQWMTLMPMVLGLYFTANVTQKAVTKE